MYNEALHKTIFWVLIIGALNWGIIGLSGFNVVGWIAASINLPILANIIYLLVGIAAVAAIFEQANYTYPVKIKK